VSDTVTLADSVLAPEEERSLSPEAPEPIEGEAEASPPVLASGPQPAHPIEFLKEVEVQASVELGRVVLSIGEVLALGPGSVVHLDKMLGDPAELVIKDRLIARGEVVVVDDKFGLRITEILPRRSP